MKSPNTHIQLRLQDGGGDMLRHDHYGVCLCAVFVFGVDDYQPPALSRAYFRAEFEHSDGGEELALQAASSLQVSCSGTKFLWQSRGRRLSKMCFAQISSPF